jgi:acyl-CoA synthetase (AMP-forming)/AMP-acid ligase II
VQLLPGWTVTPSDFMAHAARLLTPYKRPSEIIIVNALPAASTGKILKNRLAHTARDQAIGRV